MIKDRESRKAAQQYDRNILFSPCSSKETFLKSVVGQGAKTDPLPVSAPSESRVLLSGTDVHPHEKMKAYFKRDHSSHGLQGTQAGCVSVNVCIEPES
jgi:hypothetical protein